MSQKEYRAAEGISRSELFHIEKSPMHFKYALEHPTDSPSLAFGRALHKMILEPEDFGNDYFVVGEINRRTKAGREEYEALQAHALRNDMELVSFEDVLIIKEMCKALAKYPKAMCLLTGEHEKNFFWTDPITGEKCKCRPDCLTVYNGKKCIVDYKSTNSCRGFEKSCEKYGYKFQAGMYTEGLFQNTLEEYDFWFVVQEKMPPYAVDVFHCDPQFVIEGRDKYRELLGIYHDCKLTGNWYGYEGPMKLHKELFGEDL